MSLSDRIRAATIHLDYTQAASWDARTTDLLIGICHDADALEAEVAALKEEWRKDALAREARELSLREALSQVANLESVNLPPVVDKGWVREIAKRALG